MATKSQLEAQISKLEASNVTLIGYNQELEGQIRSLQEEIESLRKELDSRPQGRTPPPVPGTSQFKTLAEAQAWAKSEAKRTGKCVKVPRWG